jgi:hypothetical protein
MHTGDLTPQHIGKITTILPANVGLRRKELSSIPELERPHSEISMRAFHILRRNRRDLVNKVVLNEEVSGYLQRPRP